MKKIGKPAYMAFNDIKSSKIYFVHSDHTISIWNIIHEFVEKTLNINTRKVSGISFSPELSECSVNFQDGYVFIYDTTIWGKPRKLGYDHSKISHWAYLKGNKSVFVLDNKNLIILDLLKKKGLMKFQLNADVHYLAISDSDEKIATIQSGNKIKIYNLHDKKLFLDFQSRLKPISVHFNACGDHICLVFDTGIQIIRILDGDFNIVYCSKIKAVNEILFLDEQFFLAGDNYGNLRIYALNKKECLFFIRAHSTRIINITYNRQNKTIITCSADGRIHYWKKTGAKLLPIFIPDFFIPLSKAQNEVKYLVIDDAGLPDNFNVIPKTLYVPKFLVSERTDPVTTKKSVISNESLAKTESYKTPEITSDGYILPKETVQEIQKIIPLEKPHLQPIIFKPPLLEQCITLSKKIKINLIDTHAIIQKKKQDIKNIFPDKVKEIEEVFKKITFPDPRDIEFDENQTSIINSSESDRILVDAGPGTGKTAIACARVAFLIEKKGIEPDAIWFISFTRTAVQEIRNRIGSYLSNPSQVYLINIATIDSLAFTIYKTNNQIAKILGSYNENIIATTQKIHKNMDGVADIIHDEVSHIIIDEAQDIVGVRIELIKTILSSVREKCGVTVFADNAQAIYGFAAGDNELSQGSGSDNFLSEMLGSGEFMKFRPLKLSSIYRTESKYLNRIYSKTREKVIEGIYNKEGYSHIIDEIIENSYDFLENERPEVELQENSFILYRTRAEVLKNSSSYMWPHRLRLSGMPVCIYPWVGICFHNYIGDYIEKEEFIDLYKQKVVSTQYDGFDPDTLWKDMRRYARDGPDLVNLRKLKEVLSRSQPPVEFCSKELGTSGPVFGTIHASKGREADNVWLIIPETPWKNTSIHDETKVLFVGASRARKELNVGFSSNEYHIHPPGTKRRYHYVIGKYQKARVEIGREGDINAEAIAGRYYFNEPSDVESNMAWLINSPLERYKASLLLQKYLFIKEGLPDRYQMYIHDNQYPIAVLPFSGFHGDLYKIGKRIQHPRNARNLPPRYVFGIRLYGIRTLVIHPDSNECAKLHKPWSETGIVLAPIFAGYPECEFQLDFKSR